jgi:hypothetical protein
MERTAEEWGRVAVALPGWRWMEGLWWTVRRDAPLEDLRGVVQVERRDLSPPPYAGAVPDVDHPATVGCLLALLGGPVRVPFVAAWHSGPKTLSGERLSVSQDEPARAWVVMVHARTSYGIVGHRIASSESLGRACIAAAEALGRWPGGVS